MALSIRDITRQPRTSPFAFLISAPALIFLGALVLRTAVALWLPDAIVWVDGYRYEKVALNLLEGKGFGSLAENRLSVPTQPILITMVYAVFGKNYLALRLFFAVLGAATCVLGYALTKRLFGPAPAVVAGLLLAIYPYFIYLSALFEYPQTFFTFIMALFFLLFFRFIETNQKWALFLSGLSLGVGVLSVPTVLFFVPFVFLHLLSKSFSEACKHCLIIFVAIAIPVGSWSVRNYVAYDKLVLVNEAGGLNFWLANNETYYRYGKKAVVPICGLGYEDMAFCRDYLALRKDLQGRGLSSQQQVFEEEAVSWSNGARFIRNSPAQFAELIVKKFLEFWSPIPNAVTKGAAHGGSARTLISVVSYTPILLLALWGVFLSIAQWRKLTPIYTYFLALTAPYCVFLPTTRYRLPLDFFLIVFAAVALAHWWERRGRALVVRPRA